MKVEADNYAAIAAIVRGLFNGNERREVAVSMATNISNFWPEKLDSDEFIRNCTEE